MDIAVFSLRVGRQVRQETFFATVAAIHYDISVAATRSEETRNGLIEYCDELKRGNVPDFPRYKRPSGPLSLRRRVKKIRKLMTHYSAK